LGAYQTIAWVVTYAWHNRSDRLFQTLLIARTANRSLRCGGGRARNPSRPGGQHSLHLTGRIYACSRNACELSHDIALAIPGGSIYAITLDIIRERTNAGLTAARARGRLGGRPKAQTLNSAKKVTLAQSLYDNKNNTIEEICKTLHISRATLYRYIKTSKSSNN
jgi:hypothetical protein